MSGLPSAGSPVWVGAGAAFSGGATYVLLVVTARAVGPEAYGHFSLFWAAVVIASLGLFLPVEQVLARLAAQALAPGPAVSALLAPALRASAGLALLAVAVHTVMWGVRWHLPGAALASWLVVAFAIGAAGFVAQFTARGLLAGRRALRSYTVVIAVDAGLRAAAAVGLLAAGVRSVAPYAVAVGLSSLLCGLAGLALVRRELGVPDPPGVGVPVAGATPGTTVPRIARPARRQLVGLVVAAVCMQTLLNSAVVVAGLLGAPAEAVLAGQLLAVVTLARVPVFVFQSAQAAYVGRIAAHAHRGEHVAVTRLLVRLAAAVLAVGAASVAVAALAGPQVVRLVFGDGYDVTRGTAVVVVVGVAAYLVASVANDVAVALGAFARVAPAWILAGAGAALTVVLIPDLALRSTVPLLTGSALAALVLLPAVVARTRSEVPRW